MAGSFMKEETFLAVTVNREGFEYDIHSLVKAFFPACEVKVFAGEVEKDGSGEELPDLDIKFTQEAIFISLIGGEGGKASFSCNKIELTEDLPG